MIVGEIIESLIQTKDKMPYSKEKEAIENACNILSKFNRFTTYESIMEADYVQAKHRIVYKYED